MARGWESKAVEEQAEALTPSPVVEASQSAPATEAKSADDPDKRHRLESLRLVRSQVSEQLSGARTVTQRQILHQRLRAIDTDIESLA
ncbi:MAG: hypothetical protein EBU88_08410 [Acidobacteria bacterium]|nr:hypothetical protein [Acidobacteriota bacterium]